MQQSAPWSIKLVAYIDDSWECCRECDQERIESHNEGIHQMKTDEYANVDDREGRSFYYEERE